MSNGRKSFVDIVHFDFVSRRIEHFTSRQKAIDWRSHCFELLASA
jgi:hypothetical protein